MTSYGFFPSLLIFISINIITCYKINKLNFTKDLFFFNKGEKKSYREIRNKVYNNRINGSDTIKENVEIERNIKCKIGLEVHVQLSTKHKAFCNCFNVASLYNEKTYEKNYIDLYNYLKDNVLKTQSKAADINCLEERGYKKEGIHSYGTSREVPQGNISKCNSNGEQNYTVNSPNKHICNRCVGEVGALNLLNSTAVLFTYLISIIFNCKLSNSVSFDRKIYNYYDLPKGYQITQKEIPIGSNGYISLGGKAFRIKSIHLEEDTSKCFLHNRMDDMFDGDDITDASSYTKKGNVDERGSKITNVNNISYEKKENENVDYENLSSNCNEKEDNIIKYSNEISNLNKKILLDYNRCGIPLVEIVVQKDYMNADECINLLKEIKNKVCLLGVCVGNKENVRSDINISFEYNNVKYNRVEIKNINSFKKIRNCIDQEKKNFVNKILTNDIKQGKYNKPNDIYTKSYIDNTHYILRKKEVYNYVHERNIPEYKLNNKVIKLLKFYVNYKIKIYEDEQKYNWSKHYFHVFFNDPFLYNYFNECLKFEEQKHVSNFIVNILLDVLKKKNVLSKNILIKPQNFCFLIKYAMENNLDNTSLKAFLFNYVDVGFENEFLIQNFKNITTREVENVLKKLIDDNIKHLKIDIGKNVHNKQNFKNRIIGLLKKQMILHNTQLHVNYKTVSTFIDNYIKKLA
ncbi:glutamyl-tRNA(Gln) amidotransferase subunit B [Plasmodium gonderi]|uniref:Glutamyl-tRNA(Gln) amidotransferase subunit B n=1 Tax=Plasmodium gonderi TaxID=77519 RepID=A0A1Y1JMW8_PLAGO|nr:glutamyl-tRNA(Gln) amidotransferase subunit B [Plasmodium gonderi]GAW81743.1 glutamyl-tRNA(Gln) amidotransferase subunit B [Plasmodium gonderi]